MKKRILIALVIIFAIAAAVSFILLKNYDKKQIQMFINYTEHKITNVIHQIASPKIEVPRILTAHDQDSDGIDDADDILEGARKDAENKPIYKDAYYRGGYPPDSEGVCTDVVWRAFKNAGYDLKKALDGDIKKNPKGYKRVVESGGPDPNIDFRRVPNLLVFFDKFAVTLTTELKPGDVENLKEWQGGDIVIFGGKVKHIGILSDKRNAQGIPYLIHNGGPYTKEEDVLLFWDENISEITRHYRWMGK